MPKSYVGIGFSLCPVCGVKHDEVVLFNERLRNSLDRENFMGWAMCQEHEQLRSEGYVALIEVRNTPQKLQDAERTGKIAHVRSEVWPRIFDRPVPDEGMAFVQEGVIAQLEALTRA